MKKSQKNTVFSRLSSRTTKNDESKILLFLGAVFLVAMTWVTLNVIFSPMPNNIDFYTPWAIVGAMLLLALLLFSTDVVARLVRLLQKFRRYKLTIIAFSLGGVFLLQLLIAHALIAEPPVWDVGKIFKFTAESLQTGMPADSNAPVWNSYFMRYPNNIGLLVIFTTLFDVVSFFGGGDFWFSAIVLNLVALNLALFITVMVAKRMFGLRAAIYSGLFMLTFVIFSPYLVIPYTDTLAMPFPPLILYLYLRLQSSKKQLNKITLLVAITTSAFIGYQLKPTVLIVVIAIVAALVLRSIANKPTSREWKRGLAYVLIPVAVFGVSTLFFKHYIIASTDLLPYNVAQSKKYSLPLTHWISIGLNEPHGSYNGKKAKKVFAEQTRAARSEYIASEISSRLHELGPTGYASFLSDKAVWIFSDGNFRAEHYVGEGKLRNTDAVSKGIQLFMTEKGRHNRKFLNAVHDVWIVILLLILTPLFLWRKELFERNTNIVRLALLGFIAYLLIFEANPRYLVHFIPLFVLLAVSSLAALQNALSGKYAKN